MERRRVLLVGKQVLLRRTRVVLAKRQDFLTMRQDLLRLSQNLLTMREDLLVILQDVRVTPRVLGGFCFSYILNPRMELEFHSLQPRTTETQMYNKQAGLSRATLEIDSRLFLLSIFTSLWLNYNPIALRLVEAGGWSVNSDFNALYSLPYGTLIWAECGNVTNGMKVVIEPRVTIFYHMERNLESDQNMLLHMV